MSDKKISALTGATTPLAGTEVLPIVQSGATVKVSVDNLTIGKTVSMDKLLVGTGDSNAGVNLRKYTSAWNSSANVYPVPAGNVFGVIGDAVAGQDNWIGFTGNYGTSTGSVNILLQQNLNNTNQQAGNFIGSEAVGATTADIILGKIIAGSTTSTPATKSIQFRFTSAGNLAFNNGNGIDFSATPGTGTSELFADYEEGTFTPVIQGTSSAGTATYARQQGYYTLIGRQVFISIDVIWSAGTGTGNLKITGLPFASSSAVMIKNLVCSSDQLALTALYYLSVATVGVSSTTIYPAQQPVGGGGQADVAYDAAAQLTITGSYFV